jgi:hypothetical protein
VYRIMGTFIPMASDLRPPFEVSPIQTICTNDYLRRYVFDREFGKCFPKVTITEKTGAQIWFRHDLRISEGRSNT